MTTRSILPVVLLLSLFVFQADGFFFSARNRTQRKRDCIIKPWSSWGLCQFTPIGLIQPRTRNTVPPRNGGQPCPKNVVNHKPCNSGNATASLIQAAIGSLTRPKLFHKRNQILAQWASASRLNVAYPARNRNKTSSNARGDACSVLKDPSSGKVIAGGKCRSTRSRTSRSIKESLTSYLSRVRRQQPIESHRDVLFLIDRSGSITNQNIQKMRDMTAGLVNLFCGDIDLEFTRIGVATFNEDYEPLIPFDKYKENFQKQILMDEIRDLKFTSDGGTHMGEALQKARTDTLFDVMWGARPMCDKESYVNVQKAIFLITDGCSNGAVTIASQAPFLQAACIDVFVVQVGSQQNCIDDMLDLDGGVFECFNEFFFSDWNLFNDAAQKFLNQQDCLFHNWADLIEGYC